MAKTYKDNRIEELYKRVRKADDEMVESLMLIKKKIIEEKFMEEEREMLLKTVNILMAFLFPEWM